MPLPEKKQPQAIHLEKHVTARNDQIADQLKRLLTVKEVAAMLSMGVTTVWCQTRNGNLPQPIKIGGATRWRKADIDALIEQPAA